MTQKIGFIGGGNMATSLIGGMIPQRGADMIMVSEPLADKRNELSTSFGIGVTDNNETVVEQCDVVVIAVKPQVMQQVLEPIGEAVRKEQPLLVSIAAGITMDSMSTWLGGYNRMVRVMPNTPSLVGRGASGLFADPSVDDTMRQSAQSIMQSVGVTAWVPAEKDIDSVTALSGSGPAYFFYLMEIIDKTAVELGLDPETAKALTLQTALGAAELAGTSPDDFATLREKVTSPGGTTEAAINTMEAADARRIIGDGVKAAALKSEELARLLGGK